MADLIFQSVSELGCLRSLAENVPWIGPIATSPTHPRSVSSTLKGRHGSAMAMPDIKTDLGSFEVWFADGRPSEYCYWDDNAGRASITRKMNHQQACEAAKAFARAHSDQPPDQQQNDA